MDLSKSNLVDRLASQLFALTEVSKTLSLPLDLPELMSMALEKISRVLAPAEVGLVMLFDSSSGLFRPIAGCGFDLERMKQIALRQGESITGKVFDSGRAGLLNTPEQVSLAMADMREANRATFTDSLYKSGMPLCVLSSPISVGSEKLGVLVLAASFLLWATARAEEAEDVRFFGQVYRDYMKKTRMFIPYLF